MRRTKAHSGWLTGTSVDRPAFAASLMVFALFILGLQDSLVKTLSDAMSIWQYQLVRAAMNLVLLVLLTRLLWGRNCPPPQRVWAVALRSILLVTTMILFFGGVPFLSLSEIAAGLYVYPLFAAVLAALLLGEKVGPRRIVAILAGFTGTLFILKPGTDAFKPVALMPVAAAVCYAGTVLSTRRLCRAESPVTLAYGVAITFLIVGAAGLALAPVLSPPAWKADWPYLFTAWHGLDGTLLALIAVCSVLNVTANITLSKAYQSAEASWLAPFDYSYLVFATFWGFVFWRHVPDVFTVLGMLLIAGAGTFVIWRENKEKKPSEIIK